MQLNPSFLDNTIFFINKIVITLILMVTLTTSAFAEQNNELVIYLSADRSIAKASGLSIEQGIRTALAENSNQLGSYNVSLKSLDHHGSTPRFKKHLKQYLKDPKALVLFSGLHSPPLLATRKFINTNNILVLVPWAAAAPITRYPSDKNWIFRLSIDDSKAGHVIVHHALKQRGIKKPALLLEQTGWGKSNNKTMGAALKQKNILPATIKWFNWGLTQQAARIMLRNINMSAADAIFLVANTPEAKSIAQAMLSLPEQERLPIFSHWGITGGDFSEVIKYDMRQQLDLSFIQTSFSFLGQLTPMQQQVFNQAQLLYPNTILKPLDIKAQTGFIHAYDLTKLLIASVNQIKLTGNIKSDRTLLREALENINTPVQGLIKNYIKPFSRFSITNIDAHEALDIDDFTMANYGPNNEVILIKTKN